MEHVEIQTNGFFLHRHEDLLQTLIDNNIRVNLSIHATDVNYQEKIKPVFDLLKRWKNEGVKIVINRSYNAWFKSYQGTEENMMPFDDGDKRKSWEVCESKYCYKLYKNKIWRCPQVAFFDMVEKTNNLYDNKALCRKNKRKVYHSA